MGEKQMCGRLFLHPFFPALIGAGSKLLLLSSAHYWSIESATRKLLFGGSGRHDRLLQKRSVSRAEVQDDSREDERDQRYSQANAQIRSIGNSADNLWRKCVAEKVDAEQID